MFWTEVCAYLPPAREWQWWKVYHSSMMYSQISVDFEKLGSAWMSFGVSLTRLPRTKWEILKRHNIWKLIRFLTSFEMTLLGDFLQGHDGWTRPQEYFCWVCLRGVLIIYCGYKLFSCLTNLGPESPSGQLPPACAGVTMVKGLSSPQRLEVSEDSDPAFIMQWS